VIAVLSDFQSAAWYAWPLCPATPDEVLDLARTLERPAALYLKPAFEDDELEALATSEEALEPLDLGIMTLADVPDPAARLKEGAAEYDDGPTAPADEDPGGGTRCTSDPSLSAGRRPRTAASVSMSGPWPTPATWTSCSAGPSCARSRPTHRTA
jgi:hypothetical protein